MITNQRDSTVHDNIFINDRVNCGHDRFTFKSRCAVRSYHFNTRVPPTTTFKKLRKKVTLSGKTRNKKIILQQTKAQPGISPVQLLKKEYEDKNTFHSHFDRKTRAKKLHDINQQLCKDMREDAEAILHDKLRKLESTCSLKKENDLILRNTMSAVQRSSSPIVPYTPPTFFPARDQIGKKTTDQIVRERSRRNIKMKENRKTLQSTYNKINGPTISDYQENTFTSKRVTTNTSTATATAANAATATIQKRSENVNRREQRKYLRPSTAPITRGKFRLGPFGTAFDELWKLKMKAVKESQDIHNQNANINIKDRQLIKKKNKPLKTKFRPASAIRRVFGKWGQSVLDIEDGLSTELPSDCMSTVRKKTMVTQAKHVEQYLRRELLWRVDFNKRGPLINEN
jgi:hypothetical protein